MTEIWLPNLTRTLPPRIIPELPAESARWLVAVGAVVDDVTILNLADGSQFAGGGAMSAEAFDDPYHQTKTKLEQLTRAKVEGLLSYIPGVRVQVTAELE